MQVGTSPLLLWYALYQCQEGEKVKFFQGGKVGTLGKQSTKKCVNKEIVLIYLDPFPPPRNKEIKKGNFCKFLDPLPPP